jgi:hypothetical protein
MVCFGMLRHCAPCCLRAQGTLPQAAVLPAPQYPLCLSLLEHKRVDVKPMITHRFAFDKDGVADGFDCAARSAQTKAIKVTRVVISALPTSVCICFSTVTQRHGHDFSSMR